MSAAPLPPLLLLEDNEVDRSLFEGMAQARNVANRIDVATSAHDAFIYLEGCKQGNSPWPAAVFVDLKLPRESGLALLSWMRWRSMQERTVVVVLSGATDLPSVKRAFELGAHVFLPKSVSLDELGRAMTIVSSAAPRETIVSQLAPLGLRPPPETPANPSPSAPSSPDGMAH